MSVKKLCVNLNVEIIYHNSTRYATRPDRQMLVKPPHLGCGVCGFESHSGHNNQGGDVVRYYREQA